MLGPLAAPGGELAHRLLQHPVADVGDQPALLRERDELRRRDDAVRGVRPAHERLHADDGALRQPHDGLVDEVQLVPAMAWCRSRSSSTRSATRVRIDSSNTATASRPASLAWYMAVSASRIEHLRRGVAGPRPRRTRGRCSPRRRTSCRCTTKGVARQARSRLARSTRLRHAHDVAEHDHELVAADARDEVGRPHVRAQPVGHLDQQLVARELCPACR